MMKRVTPPLRGNQKNGLGVEPPRSQKGKFVPAKKGSTQPRKKGRKLPTRPPPVRHPIP